MSHTNGGGKDISIMLAYYKTSNINPSVLWDPGLFSLKKKILLYCLELPNARRDVVKIDSLQSYMVTREEAAKKAQT